MNKCKCSSPAISKNRYLVCLGLLFYHFNSITHIAKVVLQRQMVIAPVRVAPIKQVYIQAIRCQEIPDYASSRIQIQYVKGVDGSINYEKGLLLLYSGSPLIILAIM